MSHRVALTLAVALTLLFAAGVVNGRDRLLGVAADPAPITPVSTAVATSKMDRIIEVTVPAGILTGKPLASDPVVQDDAAVYDSGYDDAYSDDAYSDDADDDRNHDEDHDDDHDRKHDDDHDRKHDDRDRDGHDD
ncbi:MAG: hypothetical protein IT337_10010 [Thermomicrobiales bacterium]|nr:hypothetical protein [Thermomicrobiales bacterium]